VHHFAGYHYSLNGEDQVVASGRSHVLGDVALWNAALVDYDEAYHEYTKDKDDKPVLMSWVLIPLRRNLRDGHLKTGWDTKVARLHKAKRGPRIKRVWEPIEFGYPAYIELDNGMTMMLMPMRI
jgi:hypothetical protein